MLDEELEYGSKFQRHKCKQRLTKLHQMIIRKRKLRLTQIEGVEVIRKKYEKRETKREAKAEKAAQLEVAIEKELLARLKEGTYASRIGVVREEEREQEEEEFED